MTPQRHTNHAFTEMPATATTSDGRTVTGEIAAIWSIDGQPQRIELVYEPDDDHAETDQRTLNIDKERVEVGR